MAIVVIHGHQSTGKTVNGHAFMRQYGCARIVDDWRQSLFDSADRHPRPGDLVLTTETAAVIARHFPDARIVDVNTARASIGLCAAPVGGFPIINPAPRGRWYYASEREAELWFGSCLTREEAIDRGRAWAKGETFWIGLGAPDDNKLDIFEKAATPVTLAFDDANEANYGEDGEGGPQHWDEAHVADLALRLNAVFGEWARGHGYQRGWILEFTDLEEIRPILTLARAGVRESTKTGGEA
jgi:hypothetical protein